MKSKFALIAFGSILSSQLCVAQNKAPADDWKPAPSNQAGKEYPQFNSEGRVKFRIVAPKYPVLYLQHGAGEDETGWGRQG